MDPSYRQYLLTLLTENQDAQIAYLMTTFQTSQNMPEAVYMALVLVAEARKLPLAIDLKGIETLLASTGDGEDNHRFLLDLVGLQFVTDS